MREGKRISGNLIITDLDVRWTNPLEHEKLIYQTRVNEIFYLRIFIFLIVSVASTALIYLILSKIIFSVLTFLIYVALFIILFPLFIRPWQIVLSNKRLILRNKYWNIAKFSSIISFKLEHLDSEYITPRIKIAPLTLGLTILFSYSSQLIEFSFTGSISPPLIFKIVFLLGNIIGVISNIQGSINQFTYLLFSPFLSISLIAGIVSAGIAVVLIIFGLPHRLRMELSTTGGHLLSLDTGMPEELTKYLNSIGRKQRFTEQQDWKWDIPLLDDEIISTRAQVALIDRKSQLLGFLALILSIESLNRFIIIIKEPSIGNLVLVILTVINLGIIYVSIMFAKKFRRIVSTNKRIIFQDERFAVSGMYGRRIYGYMDIPHDKISGFSYSNFTGFNFTYILGFIMIFLSGITFSSFINPLVVIPITIIVLLLFSAISYKTYTDLNFSSLSGSKIRMSYRIPSFMFSLSHIIEKSDGFLNKLFPNFMTEHQVASIFNDIREIEDPLIDLNTHEVHELTYNSLINKTDEILGQWTKIGPYRYFKTGQVIGLLLSITVIIVITSKLTGYLIMVFPLISSILFTVVVFRKFVIRYNSLILLKDRLFHHIEITPRKVARWFGVLPERRLREVKLEHLNMSQFKLKLFRFEIRLVYELLIVVLGIIFIPNSELIENEMIRTISIMITGFIIVITVPDMMLLIVRSLPIYQLSLSTRAGNFLFHYTKGIEEFNTILSDARGSSI